MSPQIVRNSSVENDTVIIENDASNSSSLPREQAYQTVA
jgi:hypothetical protein